MRAFDDADRVDAPQAHADQVEQRDVRIADQRADVEPEELEQHADDHQAQ
jgi:hypothetical protein